VISFAFRRISILLLSVLVSAPLLPQAQSHATSSSEQLRFVVILTRHGVRSPTHIAAAYNRYSALPWPKWNVPPGNLTHHGYKILRLLGAYDRDWLAQQGLFAAMGCGHASRVTIVADSDQRTRATGQALAEGMFPGCAVPVHALPEGTRNPLFHPMGGGATEADPALETAAIRGRIGGDPANLTRAYRMQLATLQLVIDGCGHAPVDSHKPVSLVGIPAVLRPGTARHPVVLRGPLSTASTLTENLLLEYTNGMTSADVGWGCVDGAKLRYLLELHSAEEDIAKRTPAVARVQASDLLDHIAMAMRQQVTGKAIAGAPGKPGDRLLILAGHDTNIANVAGALHLDWILDGRRNDTPPGGALVFELWRSNSTGHYSVRLWYMAQTLEQMRTARVLTLSAPPDRVPLFMPGCGRADMSCTWQGFARAVREALRP
jgi:4-phytase/acid phosphatase